MMRHYDRYSVWQHETAAGQIRWKIMDNTPPGSERRFMRPQQVSGYFKDRERAYYQRDVLEQRESR